MSTTTIYLTRHGQTEWNVQHRMQGHMDSELTALGVQQAEWLNRGMHAVKLDVIYASPSPRALRTAEIIRGERDIPLRTSEAFKEIGVGVWEGLDSAVLETQYPEQHLHFWQDPEQFKVEGSETFVGVQTRALEMLQDILVNHQGETILIVTHSVVIKLLMAHFEERALPKLWDLPYIYPTCLCRIDFTDGVPEILLHGDTSHYEDSEAGMES
jgi:broad specificity phosphatase PhoE